MSEEENEPRIYESRRFEKELSKLTDVQFKIVDDEMDKIMGAIINNDAADELKK